VGWEMNRTVSVWMTCLEPAQFTRAHRTMVNRHGKPKLRIPLFS
jgi:hypothetical protein